MRYSEDKGSYIKESNYNKTSDKPLFDKFDEEYVKYPMKGAFGAFLGFIPGCILWLVLSYFTPFGGSMGIILAIGGLLGYRFLGKYMSYKVKNILLCFSFLLMIILTSIITSYTLYVQYTEDVLDQDSIDELRENFVTDLRNNGKTTEETEQLLKDTYNINGFNDTKGLNNFVIKTLADSYKDDHKVSCVPDTPINAIKCLYQSLSNNHRIAKPFFFNIISGLVLCIITATIMLKINYFKPENFI